MNPRARRLRRLRRNERKRATVKYTFRTRGGTWFEAPSTRVGVVVQSTEVSSEIAPSPLVRTTIADEPKRTRIDGMKRPQAPTRTGPKLPTR